ncbi:hypothetical protein [Microvirga alba]|uniref:Uncharacterized protein n=1 Tax=Microvirga alba TaxID=2791025 RepID=A0A931BNT5_9HYPH|nr:hypothetical protein [Microvirga alba]MBF9234676.1 hypothetical protein [Microvirga alba]
MNPLLVPIIGSIAEKVVDRLISAPAVPVARVDAPAVREEVAAVVKPVIEHLTNNEPWYASRVTWGAIATILSGLSALIMAAANGEPSIEIYATALTGIGGGFYTLYGRWKARKPLGA